MRLRRKRREAESEVRDRKRMFCFRFFFSSSSSLFSFLFLFDCFLLRLVMVELSMLLFLITRLPTWRFAMKLFWYLLLGLRLQLLVSKSMQDLYTRFGGKKGQTFRAQVFCGCIRMALGAGFSHGYHSALADYLLPTSGTPVQYFMPQEVFSYWSW